MKKFINKILLVVLILSISIWPVTSFAVGVGDAETPEKYEEGYIQHNCLDLSEWNGDLTSKDFEKMKKEGVDSVILRAGFSTLNTNTHKKDNTFENNIKLAKESGFDIGIYYFSSALTEEEAIGEAEYLLEIIEPYKDYINLPVAYDFETNEQGRFNGHALREMGKDKATNLCKAFCNVIEEAEYQPMVYASRNILDNYLNTEELESNYKIWIAQYTDGLAATGYSGEFYIWQYSSNITIDGIEHRIDANYLYTKEGENENQITEESAQEVAKVMSDEVIEKVSKDVIEEQLNEDDQVTGVKDEEVNENIETVKEENTNNKVEQTTKENKVEKEEVINEKENVTYELDNSIVKTPIENKYDKARVDVTDTDNFTHKYVVYKYDNESTEAEMVLANLLTGYFYSDGKTLTVDTVKEKLKPAIFEEKSINSIEDILFTLDNLNMDYKYSKEVDDNIYVNIKSSLAKGYPVVININSNTLNWNGSHLVLLVGMDENGKAIMADIYDRDNYNKKNQRIKLVNVDEFISYTNGQYLYNIHKN